MQPQIAVFLAQLEELVLLLLILLSQLFNFMIGFILGLELLSQQLKGFLKLCVMIINRFGGVDFSQRLYFIIVYARTKDLRIILDLARKREEIGVRFRFFSLLFGTLRARWLKWTVVAHLLSSLGYLSLRLLLTQAP